MSAEDIVMRECGEHGLCALCAMHDPEGYGCGELYAEIITAAPRDDDRRTT